MATRLRAAEAGPPNRVPPHNLEAEESVLGACLLSRQAIATAIENLTPEDFYKPAHVEMFRLMMELYARGEPLDAVTLGEELKRQGNLDEFGGKPYLFTLVSSVPTPGSVAHYARIVQENATLRRLIDASQQINDLAFALPEDVEEAVDQAEDLVYQVSNRRVSEDLAHLKDLLTENMELVEKLYERGSAITGVATGFNDLDELTAGFQPSNLIIVAARPSMGKALALDTPIPTPAGWTPMGSLAVGDTVFDECGQPCRIDHVSEVFTDHACYEVAFDDGASLVADAGHQWLAWDREGWEAGRRPWAVTTEQLAAEGVHTDTGDSRWILSLAEPLDLPEARLPVDPYVLGCWLGDRHAVDEGAPGTRGDRAHFIGEFEAAGYCLDSPLHGCFVLGTSPMRASGILVAKGGECRLLTTELRSLGLGGPGPHQIPAAYLRSSFKQRLALLQGLMDTAGALTADGEVRLRLRSGALLAQARELACSLGHRPEAIRDSGVRWAPLDPVFRLPHKAEALAASGTGTVDGQPGHRGIVAIRPVEPVPVRCIQVDSPNHLYLAGESMIPTHNSALALSIAQHVATNDHVPVVIFSLEMSKVELVQRLMCSEARVDSNRLRKGALQDSDWPKLSMALGRLAEAPIYIDDTPNVTIMEMRAKCRRVASKSGLGLVIVDYLQLMAPLKRTDNRVQEVSEISRSLKILARELNVPVVALSQLSRNVEYRADKRPLLADLRESGCVTADTRILRADTGGEITMGELLATGERPLVWSLNSQLKLEAQPVVNVFPSGVKEVFEVRMASGKAVKASGNHPFLTIDGWVPLAELIPGTRVATPRSVPEPLHPKPMADAEVIMLAHLIGDGSFVKRQPIRYATKDEENVAAVTEAAKHFGITALRDDCPQARCITVRLPAPYRLTHGKRNPVAEWLDEMGLFGLRSHEKFIPERIFSLPNAQVALFLRHLWATDGCVWWDVAAGIGRIYYASTSHRLTEDVANLLLRFGIVARNHETRKGHYRPCWQLNITGARNQLIFIDEIGAHGVRGRTAAEVGAKLRLIRPNTNRDTVPKGIWSRVLESNREKGNSLVAMVAAPKYSPSRERLTVVAEALDDPYLRSLATSDIFWDEILTITTVGEHPVYDATISDNHNFLANQTILHNSIEQDADLVMFIYRDEVYHPDSPQRGIAELSISKHRSGPIGKVELTFLEHYTKFANLARGM